jgi:Mg2+ and Co2+ transporter CorA
MEKLRMVIKMFWQKTRDIIVETATIVKGVKETQDTMQQDFKDHIVDEDKRDSKLYKLIGDCHDNCPETVRFDKYIKDANGTLKRIEEKYDTYHKEAKQTKLKVEKRQDDYLKKLQTIKDEVRTMCDAKKTFRQIMADIGKVVGVICLIGGLVFGIIRYCEAKKTTEDVEIEKLLKELIKRQPSGIDLK